MTSGQILFLFLLLSLGIYVSSRRNILTDRIIIIILIVLGTLLVIFPGISIKIANLLGIGRGTDLILYLFIFTTIFLIIYILSEQKKLAIKFTNFIRNDAIRNAKDLTKIIEK